MERAEAIKIIKSATIYTSEEMEALETLIPELKESEEREGERVRKDIVNLIVFALEDGSAVSPGAHTTKEEALEWLEKQKEQKPFWNPTEEDVVLFNKAITTNMTLTPQERAKLDIIRMKFKHCPYIEQKEQKTAEWSEEDEKNLELVIDCIYEFYPDPVMKYKLKDWLKSLRPRSSWKSSEQKVQKINKWSKKDKKILQSLHHVMNCADAQNIVKRDGLSVEDVCTFLFSIEPNWKPSEELMKALIDCTIGNEYDVHALVRLFAELKKL